MLRRRPALRAGRRQNLSPFRRFLIADGISGGKGLKRMHRAACKEGTLCPAALRLEYLGPVVVKKERRWQKALLQDGKRIA